MIILRNFVELQRFFDGMEKTPPAGRILDFGFRIDAGAASLSVGNRLRGNFFEVIGNPPHGGFAVNHLRGNFEQLQPIFRPGRRIFCYAFSTHITPLTGRKNGFSFTVALIKRGYY